MLINESSVRKIVREILLAEASGSSHIQTRNGKPALKFDGISGISAIVSQLTEPQRQSMRGLLNLMYVEDFVRYDRDILAASSSVGINPALFKALGLMESALGKKMQSTGSTARGFIHMTQGTYQDFARKMGIPLAGLDDRMLDPSGSIPICAGYIKYLVDKFKTPERVIFSVKNGEYKIGKISGEGTPPDAAQKRVSAAISDSDYTQITLALRALFGASGPLPVGRAG